MKKIHFKFLHCKRSLFIRESLHSAASVLLLNENNLLSVISIKISAQ